MLMPTRDARLLFTAAFARASAAGCAGVLLGIHLGREGHGPVTIGLVVAAGIAGAATMTALVARGADRVGRRRTLAGLALLTAAGLVAIVYVTDPVLLMVTAFAGLLNGMGRDRGPAGAIEQAMLPDTTDAPGRTWVLAVYNVIIDVGHAAGAASAAVPSLLVAAGWTASGAYRGVFLAAAAFVALSAVAYVALSPRIDVAGGTAPSDHTDPQVRRRIARLAGLFGIDSVGGGFLSSALIAYWFLHRYGMPESAIAALFFTARVLNAVSHLGAAWLARRIGLLNTMVFTHLPSSLFLIAAPFAPSATLAAALFLAREGLVEMDVPTRQSYVMAVVPPAQRTFASSVTNLTRTVGWAVGASLAGSLMQHVALSAPLALGGMLKIAYDILLYRSFRHVRPPEETSEQG
jgi:MFS family permease